VGQLEHVPRRVEAQVDAQARGGHTTMLVEHRRRAVDAGDLATVGPVLVDLLFDPFGGRWEDLRDAALAAEAAGVDGLWLYDHLAGSVHGAPHVLECLTVLSALAAAVPRVAVGSLVLNVANRDAGTLAVMAATLQEVSGGRLLLGIGAGGGGHTPYADEQLALGRPVPADAVRRAAVEATVATLREVWTGATGGAEGFLRPDPPVPVIIGGFGPRMAALAGRVGDGINLPGGPGLPRLVDIARAAHAAAGGDGDRFIVTTSGSPTDERLARLGVDRVITMVRPPYGAAVARFTGRG
jgi:alkanesulfonate monooxygenase SsuD/methylene tetrahydromethanopterin reductase-like flavin-dependent oxidoreductase (luciferase family)